MADNKNNNSIAILRSTFLLISIASIVIIIILPNSIVIVLLQTVVPSLNEYSFQAFAQTVPDFNFGAVGDWGCSSNAQNTVNNIVSKNTELVASLGDFSYENTGDCWLQLVDPIDEKMKIVIGNHDDLTPSMLNQYMNHFGLTKQFYSFNYQNVHFTVMSTETTWSQGSEQYNFVSNDLSAAAADPNINWIVISFHKLAYKSPNFLETLPTLRDTYHPLFDRYGVDLVLQGHDHNYQRSYPLRFNSNNPPSPIITDTNTANYNDPEGQIYATIGTGGIGFHGLTSQAPYIVYQQTSDFGFLNLDITEGGTRLSGNFYANDGTIKDTFSIVKTTPKPPPPPPPPPPLPAYHYEPSLTLTGSNYQDTPSSSSLQLTRFSVAAWFMTSNDYSANAMIANKGGHGSETAGQNMNFGIWMTSNERIQAGFEAGAGRDYFATSPASYNYNDGRWHYAVVTYDGSTVRLYIDGTQVASTPTSGATPDNTGTQPFRVGANSRSLSLYFTGNADEVRVWNRAISPTEVTAAYNNGVFDTSGQQIYLPFGTSTPQNQAPVANAGPDQTVGIE